MPRSRATRVNTGKGNDVVILNPPTAPVRRRSSSRRRAPAKRSARRRRSVSGAYSRASNRAQMTSLAFGGFGVGFIEKEFGDKLPELPLIGKKGAVALAVALINPKNKLMQDVGKAAAAISGYELGSTGTISGEVEDPYGIHGDVMGDEEDFDDYDDEGDFYPQTT